MRQVVSNAAGSQLALLIQKIELDHSLKNCCDRTLEGYVIIRHPNSPDLVKTTSFALQAEFCIASERSDSGIRWDLKLHYPGTTYSDFRT